MNINKMYEKIKIYKRSRNKGNLLNKKCMITL